MRQWSKKPCETPEPFSQAELEDAARKLKKKKAPGPDNVPSEIIQIVVRTVPTAVLKAMNHLLEKGTFPKRWKIARLALIPKGQDEVGKRKFRPICLLDSMGKLYEHMIKARLLTELEKKGGISDKQYGFRSGQSTMDAAAEVMKMARFANSGTWGRKDFCALTTLDVQNAFNTASWVKITRRLEKLEVEPYIQNLIMDYLSDRKIRVEEEGGDIDVTCGVPQGSVLGPTLWNVMYDEVLRLKMPLGAILIAFADDLAVVTIARTEEDLMQITNEALCKISRWMSDNELSLEKNKTEMVLLVGERRPAKIEFTLDGNMVIPKESIRYLGIRLDRRMNFTPHLEEVIAKTQKVTAALGRIMPKMGGPKCSTRRLLASVVYSRILYGAEVWGSHIEKKKNRELLSRAQRGINIRVACAYRTVSSEALQVLTGYPPIDLLVAERRRIRGSDRKQTKQEARKLTLESWQRRWEQSEVGAWTRQAIPNICSWIERHYGDLTFHLTQVLTSHGCFSEYLHRIGKEETALCWFCDSDNDDAAHTLFKCERWDSNRLELMKSTGIWPENMEELMQVMLGTEEGWRAVSKMVDSIMAEKEKRERERERQGARNKNQQN